MCTATRVRPACGQRRSAARPQPDRRAAQAVRRQTENDIDDPASAGLTGTNRPRSALQPRLAQTGRHALGARFDIRAFHRQVLETGSVPMAVLEAKIEAWIAAR